VQASKCVDGRKTLSGEGESQQAQIETQVGQLLICLVLPDDHLPHSNIVSS
jgi:hypothetical protein